jgi:hypothetical protein
MTVVAPYIGVYIHIYIYIYIYIYVYTYRYICIFIYICIYMYTQVYLINVCMLRYVYNYLSFFCYPNNAYMLRYIIIYLFCCRSGNYYLRGICHSKLLNYDETIQDFKLAETFNYSDAYNLIIKRLVIYFLIL